MEVDRDNFNEVLENISPRLDLTVPDTLKGDSGLKIELNFKNFADFHPEAIVDQVPRLKKLLEARQQLRDLLAKLDGNDELDDLLERVVQNSEDLKAILSQANDVAAGASEPSQPEATEAQPN